MADGTENQTNEGILEELVPATPGERQAFLLAQKGALTAEQVRYAFNLDMGENAIYEAYALLCEHLEYAEFAIGASFDSAAWASAIETMATCFEEYDDIESYKRLGSFEIDRLRSSKYCNDLAAERGDMFLTKHFRHGTDRWHELIPFRTLLHRSVMEACLSVLASGRRLRKGKSRDHVLSVLNFLPVHFLFGQVSYYNESIAKLKRMCGWKLPEENKTLILSFLNSLPPEADAAVHNQDDPELALCPIKHTALMFTPYSKVYIEPVSTQAARDDNGLCSAEASTTGELRNEFDYCKFQTLLIIQSWMKNGKSNDEIAQEISPAFPAIHTFLKFSAERNSLGEWEDVNKLCDTFEAAWFAFAMGALSEEEGPRFKRVHDEAISICYDESLSLRELELLRYTLCQVGTAIPFCEYIGNRHSNTSNALGFEVFAALLRILNRITRLNAATRQNGGSAEGSIQSEIDKADFLFAWAVWQARLCASFRGWAINDHIDSPRTSIEGGVSALNDYPEMLERFYIELSLHKNLHFKAGLVDQSAGKLSSVISFTEELISAGDICNRLPESVAIVDMFFVREDPLYLRTDPRAVSNDENKPDHLITFTIDAKGLSTSYLGEWDDISVAIARYKKSWHSGREDGTSMGLLGNMTEKLLLDVSSNVTTILFCSDGPFNNASFASLPYKTDNGKYVSDRFAVRNITSVEDIAVSKSQGVTRRGLILSAPSFDETVWPGYQELQGSELEGIAVRSVLETRLGDSNVDTLSGEAASSKLLIKRLEEESRSIVHLSSHGDVIDGVPCIILNDDLLKPGDIPQKALDHTNLIVFALCHAGEMETTASDGLSGFVKSVLLSGAVAAVLPIDAVDDMASLVFFKVFYDAYLNSPTDPIESVLQAATQRMRRLKKGDFEAILSDDEADALESRFGILRDGLFDAVEYWGPWVCYSREDPAPAPLSKYRPISETNACEKSADTMTTVLKDLHLVPSADRRLWEKAVSALKAHNAEKALRCLRKIEAHGSLFAKAAHMYSLLCMHGAGVDRNGDRSFHYALLAASDDRYADLLGQYYLIGMNCDRDLERGAELIERTEATQTDFAVVLSAKDLNAAAESFLFGLDPSGREVQQSYSRARLLSNLALSKDAENLDARLTSIASVLMDREYTPENPDAAITELWELCASNMPEAAALALETRTPDFNLGRYKNMINAIKIDRKRYRKYRSALMRLKAETWPVRDKAMQALLKHPLVHDTIFLVSSLAFVLSVSSLIIILIIVLIIIVLFCSGLIP